jgi:hypothetical protein
MRAAHAGARLQGRIAMTDVTDAEFDALCSAGPVLAEIGAIDARRKVAVRGFWLLLIGGLALASAIGSLLIASGWMVPGLIFLMVSLLVTPIVATRPLSRLIQAVKLPVLRTIAGAGGMTYVAGSFEPPVFASASELLFGALAGKLFTDLFQGADANGRIHGFCDAILSRGGARSAAICFSGQLYAFAHEGVGQQIAIMPAGGLPPFPWQTPGGMKLVSFASDAAFDDKFAVYAGEAQAAGAAIGPELRAALLGLRAQGRVFAYLGPTGMLVAATGGNRFEPGNMFRSTGGRDRVKRMFEDYRDSRAILERLEAAVSA